MLLLATVLIKAQPVNGTTTFFTNTTTALNVNTSCSVTKSVTLSGWLFSIASTSNCGQNWTNSGGGDGRFQNLVGFGTLTEIGIESDDGSEFAMDNLIWGVSTSSWTSKAMKFVGFKNGLPVSGATLNATTPSGTGILNTLIVTFTSNTAFNDVDEIRLAPNSSTCNSILFFEDITVGTATPSCITPTLSITSTSNVLCNGGSTGSATMSVSGGSGFTYTWAPSGGNAITATGLSAGIYTLTTTNSCSATDTQTVQISEPASALASSTAQTNPLCNGGQGSATVTASGGTSPYTYTWSSGPTSSVEPTLLAGTYTVRVNDNNGCNLTRSVTITQPSALITATAVTNVLCFGNSTGAATITASGGTSPYTYFWSGGQTTSVITGQAAGVKSATVTDANNCTSSKNVTVIQPASALATSTSVTNVLCFGASTGAATITASGGTSPYTYFWSGGQTTSVITAQTPGVKSATVTDASGCTSNKNVTVTQPASALASSTAVTNVLCFGASTGAATLTASGGTSPYTYLWSGAQTTSVISGQTSGVRTVTITDASNCTSTNTVTITEPGSGMTTGTAVTNVLCFGASTGAATVTVSGGSSPYTYLWSGAQTTSVITAQTSGVKTVTITDASSCNTTATVTITQPASALATSTTVTNVLCFGNSTGAATVTASGGTSPYTYVWSGAQTTSVITGLNSGARTVTVTDANSCTLSATANIAQPASALASSTAVTNVLCFGASTGSATLNTSGGTSPYTYLWSGAQTTSVISGQTAGVRTVTITDANNCTSNNTVTITQPGSGMTTGTAVTNVLCFGASTGAGTVTVSGGSSPYTYLWSGAQTTSVITVQTSGVKTVTITDASSCNTTATVNITQPASALASSTAVTNVLCFGNSTGAATVTASGGTSPYTYLWSGAQTTSVITGLNSGARTVTVTDANSCTLSATANIAQPASALASSTAVTNVLCFGASTGSASLTTSGGTAPYSYLWSGAQTTSVIGGQTSGVRTVTITDANNCTSTNTVTITQPGSGMTTGTAVTNVLCFGASTGAATVTVSGGSSPYTYLWSGAQTTSVITAQTSGVKTVTITDASSCNTTATVTITQPASALATSTTVTNVLCFGNSTGAATVTASGGTSPYTFLWSGAQTTSVITGLNSGARTVTVTDANSCTLSATANIAQPASALASSTAVTNILCFGASTGSASLTTSGGTAPYTYIWSGAQTTSVISGQTSGVRTVTITDANNCTSTNTVTITQPGSGMSTGTAVTNVLCFGASTGAGTVTVSGGSSPYTYLWSGAQTTSVITAQTSGVKTVTITDASSCNTTATVTITQPASALATSTTVTNVLCFGNSTGAATVTASGGTSPYTYLWSGAQTTSVITGLNSGARTVTITDANSCTLSATANIAQPASALASSTAVTNVLCFGNSTGSSTLTATGGTSPYTYLWSSAQTTSVISGLNASVRTVTITDANNCTTTNTITITQPASGMATGTAVTNVLCFGNSTGAATVTTSGGSGSYTYLWSSAQTTSVITGLNAGVRTVTITDASGCTSTNTVTITQPASSLATSTSVTNVLCFGNSTGAASVTASGGTSPYTYLWSSAQTTSVISSLNTGVRTITVTDANACTTANTVTINQPASALASSTAVTNVLCFGNSTGSSTLTASGGTSPYTYLWSSAQTTSVISGLNAGVRTVTLTDANNCTTTNTITITQPASGMTTGTAVTNVLCFGNSTGAATVTSSGGSGSYTYLWSSAQTTSVITGLNAGVRTVTVTDASGCTSTNTVTITQPASALATSTSVTNVLCFGNSTGAASVTASGGTSPYTYLWSSAQTNSVISSLNTGVRTITVTDANACTTTNTVTITQPASALASSTAVTNVLCFGASTGSSTLIASGGTSPYTYLWSSTQTTSVISGLNASVRTVTVTDANNCTTFGTVSITQPTSITISIIASPSAVCSGSNTTLSATASGGNGAYTYSWVSGPTSATRIVTPTVLTTYSIIVTDASNCNMSQTFSINPLPNPTITVTNGTICAGQIFTIVPNGAGTYTYSSINNTVSPASNTNYSVTATSTAGCAATNTAVVTVSVFANPTISVPSGSICSGQIFTLNPSGANTYTFSSITPTVSPAVTTSYSVSGTSTAGCVSTSSAVANVTVSASPTISVNSGTLCFGLTFSIIPTGANSYTIQGGSNTVSPSSTSSYTVIGTNTANCLSVNTAVSNVTVIPLPLVSAISQTLCNGATATLTASGANTYTWNNTTVGNSYTVNPSVTTTYSLAGTSTTGCNSTLSIVNVTVGPTPTISINSTTICFSQSSTLSTTSSTGAPFSYTWSTGSNASSVVVSPNSTSVYTVNALQAGCSVLATALSTVLVNSLPIITISTPSAICVSQTANIIASGADTYTWSNGTLSSSINVNPVSNTNYSVIGMNTLTGCMNQSSVNLIVNSLPTLNITGTLNVCNGFSANILVSNTNTIATTYSWNNGLTGDNIFVSPSVNTSYTVIGIDANFCSSSAVANVSIGALPTLTIPQGSICSGSTFTLMPVGGVNYTISGGTAIVSPTVTTIYTITGINVGGCTSVIQSTLLVYDNPVISAGPDLTYDKEDDFQIQSNASAAVSYSWSPITYLVDPTAMAPKAIANTSIEYSVVATSSAGCKSFSKMLVTVVDSELQISNYMSPNGDGINDTWKVNNLNFIKNFTIDIIDQWGNEMFHKDSNYNNEWDGTNGNIQVPDGVYYYLIKDNGRVKYKGSITLLR